MKPDVSTAGANYKADRLKMQAGLDALLADDDAGRLVGGLNILYMRGDADVSSPHGDGDVGIDGYGLGGTATWYGAQGFYVDGQAQLAWYVGDLTGEPSDSKSIALTRGNDAFGYALSLESGRHVALDRLWSLTPQAQLIYSNVKFDSFTDAFDADVSPGDRDSLKGRLGIALDRESSWTDDGGATARGKAYGIANLYYEFLDGTSVDVAGTAFDSRNDRLWGGLGAGGSYSWADDAYVFYGEALVDTSLENFAASYSAQATLGLRLNW
jgi:fibronectin-binding autotransporter adhesin